MPNGRVGNRRGRVGVVAAMLLHVACASTSRASSTCGDHVDGRRVPCKCGDIVTTDTKLVRTDPVVAQSCPIDGLIVRAASVAEGIVLDLNGLTLRGAGTGTGIRVEAGGADGALVLGGEGEERASVVGFATGISAQYAGTLRRVERVAVRSSRRDGINLRTRGTLLVDVESSDNAGHGLRLTGEGGRLIDVVAERNGKSGIYALGPGTFVSGRAIDNKSHGLVADGREIEVRDMVARGNGGRGIVVRGPRTTIGGTVSEGNVLTDVVPRSGGHP